MEFTYLSEIGAVMEILWVLGFCFFVVLGATVYRRTLRRELGRYLKSTDVHPFGGHVYRGQAGPEIFKRDRRIMELTREIEKLEAERNRLRRKNGALRRTLRDLAGSRRVTIRYIAMSLMLFIAGGFTYAIVTQASRPYETSEDAPERQRDETPHVPADQLPSMAPTMCREPELLAFEIMTDATAKEADQSPIYRFGINSHLWADVRPRSYWLDMSGDRTPSSFRITYATSGGENTKAELRLTAASNDTAPILTLF